MSAWLISIVGIVSLGVLIEIVLPEGEQSKYIRGIFSIIVIFVIVSPLPKMLKGDYIKDLPSNGAQIEIDEDYFESAKDKLQQSIRQGLSERLLQSGYEDIKFELQFDEDYSYGVRKVIVDAQSIDEGKWEDVRKIINGYILRAEVVKK